MLLFLFWGWRFFTIDSKIGSGAYGLNIALDNNYKPHILYVRGDSLFYYFNGIIKNIGYGTMPSIAIDKNNIQHISVIYNGVGYKKGITQNVEYIDTNLCYWTSISLDNKNLPHIAYIKRVRGFHVAILYSYFDGINWVVESVDTIDGSFGEVSLKIDKFNIPHIVYSTDEAAMYHRLKYATKINNKWKKEVVDTTYPDELLVHDAQPSLAIDSFYRPCIAYWRIKKDLQTELRYAVKDEGFWKIEIVDAGGVAGMHPSLCIDKYNLPHISYIKNNYLTYAVYDGFSWNIFDSLDKIRPENGGLLSNIGIAVDDKDYVYIAYNKEEELHKSIMRYVYGKGLDTLHPYVMMKIYPTVGRKIKIMYSLTKDGFVDLSIYNLLGQKVVNLVSDYVPAGTHNFDGKDLSRGVYFCLLKTASIKKTKKFIIY